MSLRAGDSRETSLVALTAYDPLHCIGEEVWAQDVGKDGGDYGTVATPGEWEGGEEREGEVERTRRKGRR